MFLKDTYQKHEGIFSVCVNTQVHSQVVKQRQADTKRHVDDSDDDGHLHLVGVEECQVVTSHSPNLRKVEFTVNCDISNLAEKPFNQVHLPNPFTLQVYKYRLYVVRVSARLIMHCLLVLNQAATQICVKTTAKPLCLNLTHYYGCKIVQNPNKIRSCVGQGSGWQIHCKVHRYICYSCMELVHLIPIK